MNDESIRYIIRADSQLNSTAGAISITGSFGVRLAISAIVVVLEIILFFDTDY